MQPLCSMPVASRACPGRPMHRRGQAARLVRAGMYVPSDSFGGVSPERKAAQAMRTFFTFVAVKIVMAQMEGSGRGSLGAYNAEGYNTLADHLQGSPMRDGDAWMLGLMEQNEMLAVRVMEVRAAYCAQDFEWGQLQRLAAEDIQGANVALLRKYASTKFGAAMQREADGQPGEPGG